MHTKEPGDFGNRLLVLMDELAGVRIAPQLDIEGVETFGVQIGKGRLERATRRDVVRHLLAGFLAARLAGIGGVQADRVHFLGPFLVVIAGARGLAEMVLPQVDHLMHER